MSFPSTLPVASYAWPTPQVTGPASKAVQWPTQQQLGMPGYPLITGHSGESRQNSAEQPQEEKKPLSPLGKAWKQIILFAPILGFISSSALIAKSLPMGVKSFMVNGTLKALGRPAVNQAKMDESLRAFGQKFLGFSVLLKSLGGISAGILSGQPSMIWGNLIQIIPSGILAFKRSNSLQNFATSMEMLLGGLYTIGFANELRNKDPKTPPEQIRRYDMTRLKSLFSRGSDLSAQDRLKGLFQTMKQMAVFTVQDHALLVKDLGRKAVHFASKNEDPAQEPSQTLRARLSEWVRQPSATKSQLAVIFFYLGTLPILLLTRKNPKIGEKRSIVALKAVGMSIANMAPFAIALNRDDLRGKAPLIGVPMAVVGMANSRNPFFVGMGHLGESFNDLFFSDVAVNGVRTRSETKPETGSISAK
jgi:hypothetical protein